MSKIMNRKKKMKVFAVYCHPSSNSFTYEVKEAFIKGLKNAERQE